MLTLWRTRKSGLQKSQWKKSLLRSVPSSKNCFPPSFLQYVAWHIFYAGILAIMAPRMVEKHQFQLFSFQMEFLTFNGFSRHQIQEMDINTLKIQNRELVVKLTERTKALETANLELATSDASYSSLSRNISSFAMFMTQVCTVSHFCL